MEYPIFYRGAEAGRLTATPDGLYWQLTAWCEPAAEGVVRLYGAEGLRSEPFGVFAPAGTQLSLHRRLSRRACPALPERWLIGRELDGFRPWQGTVEGQFLDDAMLRPAGEEQELAIPADGETAPLAEYTPSMRSASVGGRAFLVLRIKDGMPVVPEDKAEPEESEG